MERKLGVAAGFCQCEGVPQLNPTVVAHLTQDANNVLYVDPDRPSIQVF